MMTPSKEVKNSWKFDDLRIVIMSEEDLWVAQCLEYDVAAQGNSPREALKAWEHAFMGQAMANIEVCGDPMANVPRAPQHYFELFRAGLKLNEAVELLGVQK